MIRNRLAIQSGRLVKSNTMLDSGVRSIHSAKSSSGSAVTANIGTGFGFPTAGPTSALTFGGPAYNTTFMGILPEYNENALLMYYRDCYYFDSVAGATVDIISSFPFSDWTLTGIANNHVPLFSESLSRLNMRSLLQEISNAYLVDSAFIGSLVYDEKSKAFQDVLIHDFANSTISPRPFYTIDPVIEVNSANQMNQFISAQSPFTKEVLASYPKQLLDTFSAGSVVLDPLSTIYLPRRGLQDRASVSYLKRLLPVYLLEKVLYRGTLIEATKRLRSTSHITVGDDTWEPNNAEMAAILGDFQRSELDPLGAWIVTRQGVNVTDIRPGGDFWKWTDNIDTLTPFKLRALGISEAFLSGDASYATAEAAISVFLDNMDAYRDYLSFKIFTSKIFPLISVLNGLYRDPTKAKKINSTSDLLYNLNNKKNLILPDIRWHKSLEGKNTDSEFDLLEKLSEKGFTIPMKMWAAAGGVDISMMLRDLEEDQEIRDKIQQVTGKEVVTADPGYSAEEDGEDMRFSFRAANAANLPGTKPLSVPFLRRSKPLLSRNFEQIDMQTSKSGKVKHAVLNSKAATAKMNDLIVKASRALKDPNHRASIRKNVQEKLGIKTSMGLSR